MTDSSPRGTWVVRVDQPDIPDRVIEAAAAGQATLGPKLGELRATRQRFPDGVAPAAADRWIAEGGEPRPSRETPGGVEQS